LTWRRRRFYHLELGSVIASHFLLWGVLLGANVNSGDDALKAARRGELAKAEMEPAPLSLSSLAWLDGRILNMR
jgi:hypothetical protein